jgi:endonuclease III
MTAILRDARALARLIRALPDFQFVKRHSVSYTHMGAVLSDAVLQAGVNYRSVVKPRVQNILSAWPDAKTTTAFWNVVQRLGADAVLSWNHPEKPARLVRLTTAMLQQQVEDTDELARWVCTPGSRSVLLDTRGVGPKTVDYLAGLVGIDVVAVDRHLLKFLDRAGLSYADYASVASVVSFAADLMGVSRRDLDHSIWLYQSNHGDSSRYTPSSSAAQRSDKQPMALDVVNLTRRPRWP